MLIWQLLCLHQQLLRPSTMGSSSTLQKKKKNKQRTCVLSSWFESGRRGRGRCGREVGGERRWRWGGSGSVASSDSREVVPGAVGGEGQERRALLSVPLLLLALALGVCLDACSTSWCPTGRAACVGQEKPAFLVRSPMPTFKVSRCSSNSGFFSTLLTVN